MRDLFLAPCVICSKRANGLRHLLSLPSNLGLKFNDLRSETICQRDDASDKQIERPYLKRLLKRMASALQIWI